MRRAGVAAAALVLAASAVACTPAGDTPTAPAPVRPSWQAVTLPVPPGPPGRVVVRDAVACPHAWYVVGAVFGPDGSTRPAVWTSADAHTWSTVPLVPRTYYGERAVEYSIACRDRAVATIGAKGGGAHGNPRVTTWAQRPDGALVEQLAAFTLYGGGDAVAVTRMVGGPPGWLIVGGRVGGAAVWVSPDATDFQLVEKAPGLADADGLSTVANDAVALGGGWLLGGSVRSTAKLGADPAVWTATPAARVWTRVDLPAAAEEEAVQRLLPVGDQVLALGVRGATFGAWRRAADGSWSAAGRFGDISGTVLAAVDSAAAVDDRVVAVGSAAAGRRLFAGGADGTGWREVGLPVTVPSTGETAMAVAAGRGQVLLVADDGAAASAWLAPASALR